MPDKVKVTGVKFFKGTVEGKEYDSTTVYVEERLDDRRGTAKGYATTAYRHGTSSVGMALQKREFPLICEVEFDRVTNGRDSETIIAQLKPLDAEIPAKKAA